MHNLFVQNLLRMLMLDISLFLLAVVRKPRPPLGTLDAGIIGVH